MKKHQPTNKTQASQKSRTLREKLTKPTAIAVSAIMAVSGMPLSAYADYDPTTGASAVSGAIA